MLEHKIPPPIVMLICLIGVYLCSQTSTFSALTIAAPLWLGIASAVLGLGIMLSGALEFRKAKTTVNPLNPEQASELVISGIFKVTRNPMYLGMSLIIIAASIALGNLIGFAWMMAFMLYIQMFQIKPEEKAMHKLFGGSFADYCQRVRRWI